MLKSELSKSHRFFITQSLTCCSFLIEQGVVDISWASEHFIIASPNTAVSAQCSPQLPTLNPTPLTKGSKLTGGYFFSIIE